MRELTSGLGREERGWYSSFWPYSDGSKALGLRFQLTSNVTKQVSLIQTSKKCSGENSGRARGRFERLSSAAPIFAGARTPD